MPDPRIIWGKTREPKDENDHRPTWLPALDHMVDTGEIAGKLWDKWMSEPMKDAISGGLDRATARGVYVFVAAIHDLGKITPGFFTGRTEPVAKERNAAMEAAGLPVTVSSTSKRPRHEHLTMALLIRRLVESGWTQHDAISFASIPGSHHGSTPSRSHAKEALKLTNGSHLGVRSEAWRAVQDEVWDALTERFPVPDPVFLDGETSFALVGAVVLADWASSAFGHMNDGAAYDKRRVDFIWRDIWSTRGEDDRKRFSYGGQWHPSLSAGLDEIATERFPLEGGATFTMRESQRAVVDSLMEMSKPGLTIVEAPPGDGKTEAALLGAEICAARFGYPGFVFSLPTMATTSKMWSRVIDWTKTAKLPEGSTAYLGFSQSLLDDQYDALLSGQADKLDVKTSSFFTRRMGLYSPISVTTVDKVLPVALKHKYLFTSHLSTSDKVVVIDEVHSYDAYMDTYLRRTLEYLGARGVPVILLSATLSRSSRRSLIECYAGEEVGAVPEGYPLITSYTHSEGVSSRTFTPMVTGREIDYVFMDEDMDALVDRVCDLVDQGANVMVVRSTIRRAQETYSAIRARVPHTLLFHARFTGRERKAMERRLDDLYGKGSEQRPRGSVVVSTQVIEQSLDLDFDAGFSDPAPIDLLIQRVGRIWRHEREDRPLPRPLLVITGVGGDGEAHKDTYSSLIYHPAMISGTLKTLRDEGGTLAIPERISPLIESVYDPFSGERITDDDLRRLYRMMDATIAKERSSAANFVVRKPGYSGGVTDLYGPLVDANNDGEGAHSVRNIDSGIEGVLLVQKGGDLYLFDFDEAGSVVLKPAPEKPDFEGIRRIASLQVRMPDIRPLRGENRRRIEKGLEQYVPDTWTSPALRSITIIPVREDLSFEVGGESFYYSQVEGVVHVRVPDHDGI